MKQSLDFTINRHVHHADVEVREDCTFDVLELYRWDYDPDGAPRSVDIHPGPFFNIIGRELDKHIASQLVADWINLFAHPRVRDFYDEQVNECEYYKDGLCFHVDFIPCGGGGRLCRLSTYRYDPFTDSWKQSRHLDSVRKALLERAFKDALDEKYLEIDEEEEEERMRQEEAEREWRSELKTRRSLQSQFVPRYSPVLP